MKSRFLALLGMTASFFSKFTTQGSSRKPKPGKLRYIIDFDAEQARNGYDGGRKFE
jgi:hypothetical protein